MWKNEYLTPRLTCWYGDTERVTGSLPWTAELQAIREVIEPLAGIQFNSVLLNYYRDGSQPVIASVSFGEVRSFDIRSKGATAKSIRCGCNKVRSY